MKSKAKPGMFVTRAACQRCRAKTLATLANLEEGQSRMTGILERVLEGLLDLRSRPSPNPGRNGKVM